MIDLLYKNTLMKIKKSFGRYISLFIIVIVGVGFFSGLKGSSPDIISSVDKYYKEKNLMDFKIVSTLGLTNDDVDTLKSLKDVNTVVPSYSIDVLDKGRAIKVQALEKSVNIVNLISGRMPKNNNECLADIKNYKIGDKITITSDVDKKLNNKEFTVVGTIKSPLYMSTDYGNTAIGDGKLSSFIFVNKEAFTMDAYTEIYITAADTKNVTSYSKEYNTLADHLNKELLKLKPERENARYQEIYNKADNEINNNQTKLNDEKTKGENKLSEAKSELDANKLKLNTAKQELSQNESNLEEKVKNQNIEFKNAKNKIALGWNQINTALKNSNIKKENLSGKINELNNALKNMKVQQSQLPAESQEYIQLTAKINQYSTSYEGLLKLQTSITELTAQEKQLNKGIETFNTEIEKAKVKITEGKNELNTNEKKLENGYSEYNKNLAQFNLKITDAQTKIDSAKKDLSKIEKAKWYIYDRDDIVGYSALKNGTDTITSVAAVFPIFFILIVILMTSNTMARMIVEERNELGTLTSLGFKDRNIISTYLLYVLSATVFGAITGFFIGSKIIPNIIFTTFNKFILPPLVINYDIISLLLVLAVAITLMTVVTLFFCNSELNQNPAALMRPVPPKEGQKILLERIGFIWKNLSFTWKVTMRNIFRYKQKVFMTIVGVAGCTALLVAGFGLRDSMDGVAERQYGEIFKYNAMIALKNETHDLSKDLENLLTKEKVENPLLINQTTFKAQSGNDSLDTYLIVPVNEDLFKKYYNLTNKLTESSVKLDDSGAVITQKLADTLKIGKGGTIRIKDTDNNSYSLKVSDVAENYMQNYIYINKNLYSKVFGEEVSYNMLVSDYNQDKTPLANHLLDSDSIVNVTFKDDILKQAHDGNSSLNNIVILLVVIASMLVVIVLYNLTSINISERKREIATLKVLGFTDKETNEYIYREAFMMTILGIAVGLLLGILLHRFVIGAIEDDSTVYFRNIHVLSFVWSSLVIIIVSAVMQIITYFKMQTIDMIESLKSVE